MDHGNQELCGVAVHGGSISNCLALLAGSDRAWWDVEYQVELGGWVVVVRVNDFLVTHLRTPDDGICVWESLTDGIRAGVYLLPVGRLFVSRLRPIGQAPQSEHSPGRREVKP